MDRGNTPLVLVTVAPAEAPPVSRSSSSCSLLKSLNRRLGRRSRGSDGSPESRSSSTDSDEPRRRGLRSASSPSSSDSSSLSAIGSESALRKALRALSLASESTNRSSNSSSGLQLRRNSIPNASVATNSKKSPKRILRSPVAYTYVRGLSGLPTQRVPRASTCPATPSCCRNAMTSAAPISRLIQVPGLNR